jgi:hypothetical protein
MSPDEKKVYRDFGKDWMDDAEYFRRQRAVGQSFQECVATHLRAQGVDPIVSYNDGFRASVAEIQRYTRESKDLLIRGHHFEVKSRAVQFTSPDDWPRNYWPMFLDTVDGLNAKNVEPTGYIFISQKTYAIMGVLLKSIKDWSIEKRFDNQRGFAENFYCIPRSCVLSEPELVQVLQALQ